MRKRNLQVYFGGETGENPSIRYLQKRKLFQTQAQSGKTGRMRTETKMRRDIKFLGICAPGTEGFARRRGFMV